MSKNNSSNQAVFWLYGLSGAGKTTLANSTADSLHSTGSSAIVLDGDQLRSGMCNDLGFSLKDRLENVRRTAELAKLLCEQGFFVLVALMTPQEHMRQLARAIVGDERFNEVYVKCDIATCMRRDPKGLYMRATTGQLKQFAGLDLIFDEPWAPNLVLDTAKHSIDTCVNLLFGKIATGYWRDKQYLS